MNAAIRAAVLIARSKGLRVVGVENGYRGLLDGRFRELHPRDVQGILREGGTVLGSARCLDFHEKAARDTARDRMRAEQIEGLVVIGGNGSLTGALALGDREEAGEAAPHVIGVPASIDNDVGFTRMAIGVDTAVNTIVDACDKIADTARAHHRAFFVEVMGRQCGYLAMSSYIAAGADIVLFPEANEDPDKLVSLVATGLEKAAAREHASQVLIIVAEGVSLPIQELKARVDKRVASQSGASSFETRVTVLGHVVRGGRPSASDRIMASRLANVAVRGLLGGERAKMVAWQPSLALLDGVGGRSPDDPHCWFVGLQDVIKETEGLLAGTSGAVSWRAEAMGDVFEAMLL